MAEDWATQIGRWVMGEGLFPHSSFLITHYPLLITHSPQTGWPGEISGLGRYVTLCA